MGLKSKERLTFVVYKKYHGKGLSTRTTTGKNTQCKLFRIGNETESNGNTIFIAKKWIEKVLEVKRARDRLIMISLLTNKKTVVVVSTYIQVLYN